jgi:hypothetical protein
MDVMRRGFVAGAAASTAIAAMSGFMGELRAHASPLLFRQDNLFKSKNSAQ